MSEQTLTREKTAALNEAFFEKVAMESGRAEITANALSYIKQRLREESFARKILIPVPVTKHDVQRAVNHDTVQYIADIEFDKDPAALAMALNFTSEPTAIYVRAKRFAIDFFKIETPWYEKTEQELYAYNHPIIKVIEENSVKDIQYIEDGTFIGHCNSIFDTAGSGFTAVDATVGATDGFSPGTGTFSGNFDRKAVLAGMAAMNGEVPGGSQSPRKLRGELILVSEMRYLNWLDQRADSIGTGTADKITVSGYEYDTILGRKLITTTKIDLLPADRFFVFAAQRYFGHFLVLNATKFYIDKIADLIRWKTWEIIGMGFGNVRAVMRVAVGT
jgi:hypothetical protein